MGRLKVLSFVSQILAEIGFTDLASIEYKHTNMTVVPLPMTGKDSLFEGVLLYQTGTLHNIRFYSPYVKRVFEKTASWYKADPVHDSPELINVDSEREKLAYVLCRLFPSQTGTVSIVADNHRNLTYILKTLLTEQDRKEHKDLKMLAGILFCLMHKSSIERGVFSGGKRVLRFELSKNTARVEYTVNLTDKGSSNVWTDRLDMLQTLINTTNDPTDRIFDTRAIFKAFLAIYLEDKDSLKYFYEEYFALFKQLDIKLTEQTVKADDDKIKKLLTSVERELSRFPYRPNSTPPYRSMPCYLGNGQFNTSETFSTCSESALYHLCNCILWDADRKAYISVTDENNNISILSREVFKNNMRGIPDYTEMTKWHRLIENLPDGVCCNTEGFKTYDSVVDSSQKVFYARECNCTEHGVANNEVEPGLINFIRLLEVLTNNNGTLTSKIVLLPIFATDDNNNIDIEGIAEALKTNTLNRCIENIFRVIVGNDNIEHFTFDFQNARLINCNGRYDIYGRLNITRRYPKEDFCVKYELSLCPGHAELFVLSSTARPASPDGDAVAPFLNSANHSLELKLAFYAYIREYLDTARFSEFAKEVDTQMANNSLLCLVRSRLGPDESSRQLMDRLLITAYKNGLGSKRQNTVGIVENFLKSIPVDDRATSKLFALPILFLMDRLGGVPCVFDMDEEYLRDVLVNSMSCTGVHTYRTLELLQELLHSLAVELSPEFSRACRIGRIWASENPLVEGSINFASPGSLDLARRIDGVLSRTLDKISFVISHAPGMQPDTNFGIGTLRTITYYLYAYCFLRDKIDQRLVLTKREYLDFITTFINDDVPGSIMGFVPSAYRVSQRLHGNSLSRAMQILVCAKRKDFSKCDAVLTATTLESQFIIKLLLLYDLLYPGTGLQEYLLETQTDPEARKNMLDLCKAHLWVVHRVVKRGHYRNSSVLPSAIHPYIAIFKSNGLKLDSALLNILLESQLFTIERLGNSLHKKQLMEGLSSVRQTVLLLHQYLRDVLNLWGSDRTKMDELEDIMADTDAQLATKLRDWLIRVRADIK